MGTQFTTVFVNQTGRNQKLASAIRAVVSEIDSEEECVNVRAYTAQGRTWVTCDAATLNGQRAVRADVVARLARRGFTVD